VTLRADARRVAARPALAGVARWARRDERVSAGARLRQMTLGIRLSDVRRAPAAGDRGNDHAANAKKVLAASWQMTKSAVSQPPFLHK
jgi:hypothetical protein